MPPFNFIDLFAAVIIIWHLAQGVRMGVFVLVARFASFIAAFLLSFLVFQYVAGLLIDTGIPAPFARLIGFFGTLLIIQSVVSAVLGSLINRIPFSWHNSFLSKLFALVPAFIDGLIVIVALFILALLLPLSSNLQRDIADSYSGNMIAGYIPKTETYLKRWLGGDLKEALTFFTVQTTTSESHELPYRPKVLTVSPEDEQRMLELVNMERAKEGAPPLIVDSVIVEIARKHSRDMWERGYFSHTNPDGQDPFDRMRAGGATFVLAGENLAYAPNVELAHQGLMNSPGHRRNLLDPRFRRVGIGVIDGGVYGQIFTQNFAN